MLKFRSVRIASLPMANLLADYLQELGIPLGGFTVVPVPLSAIRERSRGFNQAALIGNVVASRLGLPMATDWIVRARDARPQSNSASVTERRVNMRGAFSVPRPERVLHRKILLIDDVRTSGATLDEAVRTLKAARATRIIAAVVAHA
jgi:ComF family protein